MTKEKDEAIKELVRIVLSQDRELEQLREKLKRIESYIEIYEEYVKRA